MSSNKKFYLYLCFALIFITSIPFLVLWLATPLGYQYNGLHSLTPGDTHLYYSYVQQVKQGSWLLKDLYTPEPNQPILFNFFFLITGLIAKIFQLSPIVVLHLLRVILIPIFVYILIKFVEFFYADELKKRIAVLLICFSSGLGYLYLIILKIFGIGVPYYDVFHVPMDSWVPEFNTFLTLYHNSLYIVSLLLIIVAFWQVLLAFEKRLTKNIIYAGLAALVLFNIHPYHLPTILGVLGIYTLYLLYKKNISFYLVVRYWTIFLLVSSPAIVYNFWLLANDWVTRWRFLSGEGVGGVPFWWVTLVSYGIPLIIAIWSIYLLTKDRGKEWDKKIVFLLIWLIVGSILIHLNFLKHPRRLTEGLQLPLILIAIPIWYKIYFYLFKSSYIKHLLGIFFGLFLVFSNLAVWILDIGMPKDKYNWSTIYYDPGMEEGFRWIVNNVDKESIIFSSSLTGNFIPGVTGRTVFIGHTPETYDSSTKKKLAFTFFNIRTDENSRKKIIDDYKITYLWYGPEEKKYGDYNPLDDRDMWTIMWHGGNFYILKYKK